MWTWVPECLVGAYQYDTGSHPDPEEDEDVQRERERRDDEIFSRYFGQGCQMAKFDPFLSLDCAPTPSTLAPPPSPPWRDPRRGRDQILPSGNPGYNDTGYTDTDKVTGPH